MERLRILLVEGNEDCRRVFRYQLRHLHRDIELIETETAEQAYFVLTTDPPDIMVTEVVLPEHFHAGIELVAKAHAWHGNLPIIVYTTQITAQIEQAVRAAGATDFVHKPSWDRNEPMATVARYLPTLH